MATLVYGKSNYGPIAVVGFCPSVWGKNEIMAVCLTNQGWLRSVPIGDLHECRLPSAAEIKKG